MKVTFYLAGNKEVHIDSCTITERAQWEELRTRVNYEVNKTWPPTQAKEVEGANNP
ncbi:MAG: hypothetical protein U1D67_03535 [Dehalococcoidia bacterium]|nr:hypothetical protein [Dehalococcoidia bacterium]